MKESRLKGIYNRQGKKGLYTLNLTPGSTVYDERLSKKGGHEYRSWSPERSKLAAAILKNISQIGIMPGSVVLYLGASTGTTVSHVSDIVGREGFVFAVEFAPRVARELVFLAQERPNIAPILADANRPETYLKNVAKADAVYQDIAQKNQVEIFLKNMDLFLKKGGFGLIAVKARSIDMTRKPKSIYNEVKRELEKSLIIVDNRVLEPFEKDHCFIIVKKK